MASSVTVGATLETGRQACADSLQVRGSSPAGSMQETAAPTTQMPDWQVSEPSQKVPFAQLVPLATGLHTPLVAGRLQARQALLVQAVSQQTPCEQMPVPHSPATEQVPPCD